MIEKSFLATYALKGFSAILKNGFCKKHIIIVGGDEARYKKENPVINRAQSIKKMLVDDFNLNPNQISYIVSAPHTIGNVVAIEKFIKEKKIEIN